MFNAVKNCCLQHGFDKTYWLALSGGLDSSVLLHLLVNLRSVYPIKLNVIHVHHGLSANADAWAMKCETLCREYNVPFLQRNVNAQAIQGESPENIARKARYDVFAELLSADDILVTAHHQDDQAETMLIQLLRGAGPKGLAAMPRVKLFASGLHVRPLLDFSRDALHEYAEKNQLSWVNDESNADVNFTRNFIRHEVLTLLKSRWPNVTETLSRSAEHCAEAQELLNTFSQQDLLSCQGSVSDTLSIEKILQLDIARQRQVLRLWFSQKNFPIPSSVKMQHILQDVLHARADKSPHIIWGDVEVRRYRDDLYVRKCTSGHDAKEVFVWDLQRSLLLPGIGELCVTTVMGQGLRSDIKSVSVRYRSQGESLQLPGHKHHHFLKNLFQEWGVPSWSRDKVPLIFVGNELAAVVGYAVAEKFIARKQEEGAVITLKPSLPLENQ